MLFVEKIILTSVFFENLGDEQGFTGGVCEFGPFVVFIVLFWFYLLVLDLVQDGRVIFVVR